MMARWYVILAHTPEPNLEGVRIDVRIDIDRHS